MAHSGGGTCWGLLLGASLVLAACSGGSSHGTNTTASPTNGTGSTSGQSTASTPSGGSIGYGPSQLIQTSDGYQYSVAVSKFSLVTQPTGLEPAPPGKDYISFIILVTNPLSDRAEPIAAFDGGNGQVGSISMGAPLGDSAFNCSPTDFSSPPVLATNPPVCNTNDLTVSDDTAQDTGTIPAKSTATVVFVTGDTVPANVDLTQLKIYYAPPGYPNTPAPTLLPQPS
jgi:hypothetical protein